VKIEEEINNGGENNGVKAWYRKSIGGMAKWQLSAWQ
jgi:hypothetical protein